MSLFQMIYGNIFLNTNKIFGGILLKIFANIDIVNSNLSNPNEKNLRHVRQFQNIKGLHRKFELILCINYILLRGSYILKNLVNLIFTMMYFSRSKLPSVPNLPYHHFVFILHTNFIWPQKGHLIAQV